MWPAQPCLALHAWSCPALPDLACLIPKLVDVALHGALNGFVQACLALPRLAVPGLPGPVLPGRFQNWHPIPKLVWSMWPAWPCPALHAHALPGLAQAIPKL